MAGMALAVGGALEPAAHAGQMRRKKKSGAKAPSVAAATDVPAAKNPDTATAPPKRRRRKDGAVEDRIGHRFKDAALLDCALTHISALTGSRNHAATYQRLEFLGDHVLGLAV